MWAFNSKEHLEKDSEGHSLGDAGPYAIVHFDYALRRVVRKYL